MLGKPLGEVLSPGAAVLCLVSKAAGGVRMLRAQGRGREEGKQKAQRSRCFSNLLCLSMLHSYSFYVPDLSALMVAPEL